MDLNDGLFRQNGCCGFVLKPDFLRDPDTRFSPDNPEERRGYKPLRLSIQVHNLMNLFGCFLRQNNQLGEKIATSTKRYWKVSAYTRWLVGNSCQRWIRKNDRLQTRWSEWRSMEYPGTRPGKRPATSSTTVNHFSFTLWIKLSFRPLSNCPFQCGIPQGSTFGPLLFIKC